MSQLQDFTPGRDEALGVLLRERFASADDAAFAARMRAAAEAAAAEGAWRAVARWTLPGLAAAAVLLAVLARTLAPLDVEATAAGSFVELASDASTSGGTALLTVMAY